MTPEDIKALAERTLDRLEQANVLHELLTPYGRDRVSEIVTTAITDALAERDAALIAKMQSLNRLPVTQHEGWQQDYVKLSEVLAQLTSMGPEPRRAGQAGSTSGQVEVSAEKPTGPIPITADELIEECAKQIEAIAYGLECCDSHQEYAEAQIIKPLANKIRSAMKSRYQLKEDK